MMSALSRDVHCIFFCSATEKQRLLKESIKIDAKIREIHQHVTSEHRAPWDVPLSEVSLHFRASVQAFSKKCGVCRLLRCTLIWAGGSDHVMSALSRGVHCFCFCSATQNQR